MNFINKIKQGYNRIIKPFFLKFYNLFSYQKPENNKTILVLGGYGYNNVGDEAQLDATLSVLKKEFPKHMIKVLTPNEYYTYFYHKKVLVGEAPRTAFYNSDKPNSVYNLNYWFMKIRFLFTAFLIYINSYLVRADLPTLFINSRKAALLHEVKKADKIYFSGGGFLTGKTLSRLWDGIFFINISDVLKVPVFLSGQTVGIWGNKLNRMLAKWGFSKAKLITTRDPEASINDLKDIGLEGDNIFVTHDDALFCDKLSRENEIINALEESGMSCNISENKYITLQIHYYGLKDKDKKEKRLKKFKKITEYLLEKYSYSILLIPMTPSDEIAIDDFMDKYDESGIYSFKYNYDFKMIRSIIANSKICITMKHHPIIFAVGEKIPVISLASGDYYIHKNEGALKLFGLDKYNIDIDKENHFEEFKLLFQEVINNNEKIIRKIEENTQRLEHNKNKFIELIKSY